MARGVIKKLHADKGFGFVRPEGWTTGQADIFFHRTGVELTATPFDDLKEGQQVSYTQVPSPKGPRAVDVRTL